MDRRSVRPGRSNMVTMHRRIPIAVPNLYPVSAPSGWITTITLQDRALDRLVNPYQGRSIERRFVELLACLKGRNDPLEVNLQSIFQKGNCSALQICQRISDFLLCV